LPNYIKVSNEHYHM